MSFVEVTTNILCKNGFVSRNSDCEGFDKPWSILIDIEVSGTISFFPLEGVSDMLRT